MGKILIAAACCLIACACVLTGCNSGGCTELRSSVPRADFYNSSTNSAITVDSLQITGVGVPGDSILYGPSTRNKTVYLPMPAEVNSVQWRIAYMQTELARRGIADTVSIDFDRTPWFAGEECGAMFKYRITRLATTTNVIDSVVLVDSVVVNVDAVTFKIYFRTGDEPIQQ